MVSTKLHALSFAIIVAALSACQGTIADVGLDPELPVPEDRPLICDDESIDPGARTPLLRLTRAQYNNAVRDLLGMEGNHSSGFLAENDVRGVAVAGAVGDGDFSQYELAARALAEASTLDIAATVECGALTGTLCARDFATRFATLAYRRPLVEAEVDSLMALFELGSDFDEGIATLIEVVLQSPHFIYRPEFSEEQGIRQLTGLERATRLSFFLWNSIPDQALLDAATSGALDSNEGVRAQATRMVADRKAVHAMHGFFRSWFEIKLGEIQRASALIADIRPLADAADAEFDAFIEYIMFESTGTLEELFTTSTTFVNEVNAPYYGLNAADFGPELERVDLDASQRRGILTMLPVLLAHSAASRSSPVTRGVFIRRNILCGALPNPPDDVTLEVVEEEGVSERDRLAEQNQDRRCANCHVRIDPLGLPFENFDALGRFRTEANGASIITNGEIGFTRRSDAEVVDAFELTELLAVSEDVASCAAKFVFKSANGRFPGANDACALQGLTEQFQQSEYSLSALIVALVESDPFLYQDNTEVSP